MDKVQNVESRRPKPVEFDVFCRGIGLLRCKQCNRCFLEEEMVHISPNGGAHICEHCTDRKKSESEPYLTTKELAAVLGYSIPWLWLRTKEGMPRYKLGPKTVRFKLSEVETWLITQGRKTRKTQKAD